MTDKVQKIKDWICKEQDGLMDAQGNFEYPEHEGAYHILCNLDAYIDSLQEEYNITGIGVREKVTGTLREMLDKKEPKKKCMYSNGNYTNEDRQVLCDGCEELCKYNSKTATESLGISQGEYDKIVDGCIYGKEPELVDADDLLKEEPVSEDLEKMSYHSAMDLINNPKFLPTTTFGELIPMLQKLYKDGAKWQKTKDESTTEDLGEYIDKLSKQFPEVSFAKLSRIAVRVAKWQKQKDDGEIKMVRELLADFDKHCDEYHEAGFKHGQEALMKDATETTVHIGAGNYPYIPQMELYDYDKDVPLAKAGDRYKIILIKEG